MHNLIITIRGCDHKINCAVAGFGVWHWECVVECADRVMHFIMTKVDLTLLNYFRLNFMTIELLVHTYFRSSKFWVFCNVNMQAKCTERN